MSVQSTETSPETLTGATRSCTQGTIALTDGQRMFYRAWIGSTPPAAAVLLLHRGHEHSGRFDDVIESLDLPDEIAIFAYDARGHGRSEGDRGYAPSFAQLVRDVDTFARHICRTYALSTRDLAVLGHSVGAVAAAAWVHDYAPPIRALVLVTPALRIKLYVPFALPGLRLLHWLRRGRKAFIKSYVKARMLTHDEAQAQRYDADPLIARSIAVNVLLDLHDTSTRLLRDAAAIEAPTLLLSAGRDWVVDLAAQKQLFARLSSPIKRIHVFDGMHHDLLHETNQPAVTAMIRQFILERFSAPDGPLNMPVSGREFSHDEFLSLLRPLPAWSIKRWSFAIQRWLMRTVGRLSGGIALGWRTGFSSGRTLDYIYQNRPQGIAPIGSAMDRMYLNSIGWRGIRRRKANLQIAMRKVIVQLRREQRPVRLLDLAAGTGRYIFDTIATMGDGIEVHLRDADAANLAAAGALAASMGLKNLRTQVGDAFDPASLSAISPSPTVVIVSGLYELFPDNDRVAASLGGIARCIEPGGYLIYTGQPWHPQLEMIARVLTHGDGRRWVMRRRSQCELDALIESAGFVKRSTEIDDFGIFTVSVAQRIESAADRAAQLAHCAEKQLDAVS